MMKNHIEKVGMKRWCFQVPAISFSGKVAPISFVFSLFFPNTRKDNLRGDERRPYGFDTADGRDPAPPAIYETL